MKKILIVVDMQNDFITGPLGTEEARAIVPNVVGKVGTWDGSLVIFTRDTHFEDYLNTLEGRKLPVPHCVIDTEGRQIIDELKEVIKPYTVVVDKHTFGFDSWKYEILHRCLDDISSLNGLDITLVGVCTDICVVSNALALRTAFPNCKITVDATCCAGTTVERHKAALEVMKSCQIEVIGE